MVAWLKIILPLAALAILLTLFLVSRTVDPTLSIPFADPELRELANQPRIGKPTFSGVAENGAAFNLAAEVAVPLGDDQSALRVDGISATFESPDGRVVHITAASGTVDSTTQMANLSGGVTLATSFGYHVETDGIIADMDKSRIFTTGAIVANGPLGRISAGLMVLQQQSVGEADTYELVFRNGVKLVYEPSKNQE